MKKFILFIIPIFLCLLMISCSENVKDDAESFDTRNNISDDNTSSYSENIKDDAESFDTGYYISEDNISSNNNQNQDGNHTVPYILLLSSIDEMNDFLNITKGNSKQYKTFIQNNNLNVPITQSYAKKIAGNIEQNDIPLIKSDLVVDGFGAMYYLDRNELDIVYRINGIRHRFIYRYNETSPFVRTTPPILENLTLGNYVFDLYQGDKCLVGEIVADSAVIQVIVYTEQISEVKLNAFNMGSLSGNTDK